MKSSSVYWYSCWRGVSTPDRASVSLPSLSNLSDAWLTTGLSTDCPSILLETGDRSADPYRYYWSQRYSFEPPPPVVDSSESVPDCWPVMTRLSDYQLSERQEIPGVDSEPSLMVSELLSSLFVLMWDSLLSFQLTVQSVGELKDNWSPTQGKEVLLVLTVRRRSPPQWFCLHLFCTFLIRSDFKSKLN